MHWGKILSNDLNRTNNVTNNLVDPVSKETRLKFCAVSVENIKKERADRHRGRRRRAHGFVRSYRALNQEDEIVIFSKENLPFYNRVQLPDYISGAATLGTACPDDGRRKRAMSISGCTGVSGLTRSTGLQRR